MHVRIHLFLGFHNKINRSFRDTQEAILMGVSERRRRAAYIKIYHNTTFVFGLITPSHMWCHLVIEVGRMMIINLLCLGVMISDRYENKQMFVMYVYSSEFAIISYSILVYLAFHGYRFEISKFFPVITLSSQVLPWRERIECKSYLLKLWRSFCHWGLGFVGLTTIKT